MLFGRTFLTTLGLLALSLPLFAEDGAGGGGNGDDADKSKTSDDGDKSKTGDDADKDKKPWGDDFDPERAWNTIQNQRKSEDELRGTVKTIQEQLEAANKRLAEIDDAGKTDAEKTEARIKALEDQNAALVKKEADTRLKLVETEIRYTITLEATKAEYGEAKARFRDPAVALKLIDRESLQYDDAGLPKDGEVKKALVDIAKAHPYLLHTDDDDAGAGNGHGKGRIPATKKSGDAKDITDDEIKKRREAARRGMANLLR